ncbi:MAG: DUF4199 domain-containing protein, partial [Sphingomonadales bacterium]
MLRTILIYGAIAGLAVGLPLSALVLNDVPFTQNVWFGYLTMLVALTAVFVAVKRHRDDALGGVIRFWPAFGLGLAVSAVAGIFYTIAWESAVAISGVDFIGDYARAVIAGAKAKGASAAELAKLSAAMEGMKADYANPLFRLPMVFSEIFPVGILVSLVSAG